MKNQKGLLTVVLFSLLFVWQAAAFNIGDRVQANGTVNVRQTAAGTLLGSQSSGSQGAVIGGPTVASLGGTSYTWYNINFDAGTDGWVADIGLISAAPTVQTSAASSITTTTAQLNSTVNPNGSSTTFYFQYGTTTGYGSTTASGNTSVSLTVNYSLTGLAPGTTYHYRIVAYNSTGTSYGGDVTFTTSAPPAPTVQTLAANSITPTSAQLNSTVNPNGSSTTFYFQYGTTTGYGSTTASGNTSVSLTVNYNLTGLAPNTTYHYRIVASNGGGTGYGSDVAFTTSAQPAPTVQTLAADTITATSGHLNSTVNPNGASTTFYFQYGTTASYGNTTASGNTSVSLSVGFDLTGLTPNTTYHYRIVASNSGGTSYGSDATFTTSQAPVPIIQTLAASLTTTTAAQLNSTVNPNGSSTTFYFQYGTTAGYGSTTASGNTSVSLSVNYSLTGLTPNTTYHYRIVASNSSGTSYGSDVAFTTAIAQPGPIVQTLAASSQTANAAQLNAYLNPNGFSTTAYFQYGTTTGYGSTTPSGNFGTTPQNIGYNITGLTPSTTYHYRIVAYNSAGTSYGLDSSFVTTSVPGSTPPTIVTQPQSQTVQAGVNVTFTVGVSGTTPLSYQWLRNGVAMSGKTSASMTLNSVGTFDSDGYSVIATNSFGKKTSATAWLAVYSAPTNSPPPTPIVVQTNRPAESSPVVVSNAQLKVFVNGRFTNGTIDLSKMTIVFTHGWRSDPDKWATNMAANMVASGVVNANLLAWDWRTNANTINPFTAFQATPGEGWRLGQALANTLGTSYDKPIHFIGHSFGTLVNAQSANYLHEQTTGALKAVKVHMTLMDEAELANIGGVWIQISSQIPGILTGNSDTLTVGWTSPLPRQSEWVDNYISLVGWPHQSSVNVWLNQGIDRADHSNPISSHGYANEWYGATAANINISILGDRYSFERLGFSTSPKQACPYPPASLFVQDTYPLGEYALHEPSLLEFDLLVVRNLAMITTYSVASGINLLTDIGQTTGDAHVDVQMSAAPTMSGAGSSIVSTFFYSLRAILNSSSGSQSQLALRSSASPQRASPLPQDAGSGIAPPCVWLPITVPTNAVLMSFDFTFTGEPGNDFVTASIAGTNVFALEAQFVPQNQRLNSGSIPVSNWAGKNVELFFGLVGGSSSNATVTIDAMRFYQLTPPGLSITTSGSKVVVSWPASAQDYVLESANSLIGTNQWSAVTNTPSTNALWIQMTNSVSGSAKFYRLKK
jgi:Immunoglobulin I-set domain./Fibronectin type III domain.